MNLTFDEAIENHRKMWNWIADETEKRKQKVTKENYFDEKRLPVSHNRCFCCKYTAGKSNNLVNCEICPIDWKETSREYEDIQCYADGSPYGLWSNSYDWKSAAKYAREIANLPAREEVRR